VVVILDHDPDSCAALVRELKALGRGAVVATSPAELVQRLEDTEQQCEIALIDLELGSDERFIDGIDLLVHLAQEHPSIRRVLMSSRRDAPRDPQPGDARGIHAVLAKPWTRASLLRALGPRES
jgi:CheY-like chemotaxis protein